MIQSIDHLGIAVRSLDEAIPLYEQALGLHCLGREEVAAQKFLTERGEGIHHLAFRTDDIAGQLRQAAGAGVRLIHEKPFAGAAGKQVAFLHPKSTRGVLTEFCAVQPDVQPAH